MKAWNLRDVGVREAMRVALDAALLDAVDEVLSAKRQLENAETAAELAYGKEGMTPAVAGLVVEAEAVMRVALENLAGRRAGVLQLAAEVRELSDKAKE